jgi:hypothetical protein
MHLPETEMYRLVDWNRVGEGGRRVVAAIRSESGSKAF